VNVGGEFFDIQILASLEAGERGNGDEATTVQFHVRTPKMLWARPFEDALGETVSSLGPQFLKVICAGTAQIGARTVPFEERRHSGQKG